MTNTPGLKPTYTCDCCGETFYAAWSKKEAKEEAQKNFPDNQDEPQAIVCDDCYKAFMAWHTKETP